MKGKKALAVILAVSVMMTNGSIAFAAEDTAGTGSSGQAADISEQAIGIDQQEVSAYGTSSEGQTEDGFSYTITDGQATITEYTGTDTVVEIPETVEGTVPVTTLASNLFLNNTQVEEVTISKNVTSVGTYPEHMFRGASSLHDIYVEDGNKVFYDIDGVLFFYGASDGLPILMKYPEAKEGASYTVPGSTYRTWLYAFYKCRYLKKIVTPLSVGNLNIAGFADLSDASIILQQTDPSQIDLADRAFAGLTNCTIIVKNQEMKNAVELKKAGATPMYNCTNTEVKIVGDPDLDNSYRTPATSLVFTDTGAASKSITLKPGESQAVSYAISPADTTDSVTWESSDSEVATVIVKNGKVTVTGVTNGECTITGRDESRHTLTLDVDVWQTVTETTITYNGNENPETLIAQDCEIFNKYITFRIYPYDAKYRTNVIWKSSNPEIISVAEYKENQTDGFYSHKAALTMKKLGTATITATLMDGANTITRSVTIKNTRDIFANDSITVGSIKNQTYTGKALTPSVTVKDGSTVLKEGTDYKVSYSNNKNVGQAEVTITGIGNYTGSITEYFDIVKASKASQKITGVSSSYKKAYKSSFTLKPKAKTTCTYKTSNSKIATVNSKGKVTIKGTGKATITVTAKATSAYKSATKKITIYAIPAKMKTPAVKDGKKKLTVSWKKDSKADGYQIQYSTSSKFKNAKTVSCSKKTVKTTIKKLKSGKKYYVRIRAYKKIGNKKYYGSYSKVKSVKVK